MYHKGVNRELVIQTAVELAEKNGLNSFSMHQLAEALGIRTASLYKHVSGLDDVITELGRYSLKLQIFLLNMHLLNLRVPRLL